MDAIVIFVATKFHYLLVGGAILTWILADASKRRNLTILGFFALPTTFIVGKLFSLAINNPRPFIAHDIQPLFAHVADNGFPSEHALLATAISALVFTVNKPFGFVLFAISLMIGTARVAANVHHTLDIVGGIVIALVVVYLYSKYLTESRILKMCSFGKNHKNNLS